MPSDTLYGNKYKYILSGIDVTSRYKVERASRSKQAKDVADMIADIYKVGPLTYPKIFQCDNGSEFKVEVTKMLEKHEVKIRRVTTKYKHTHTAFVKALNKMLTERLFKVQDAQELNDPDKVLSTFVRHLYGLVDELHDTQTQMTGMKLKDAIKLNQVPLVNRENFPPVYSSHTLAISQHIYVGLISGDYLAHVKMYVFANNITIYSHIRGGLEQVWACI